MRKVVPVVPKLDFGFLDNLKERELTTVIVSQYTDGPDIPTYTVESQTMPSQKSSASKKYLEMDLDEIRLALVVDGIK